jgi:nucleotide-binding universal stress UspA family protein
MKILVPVDGSSSSNRAVKHLIRYWGGGTSGSITLMYVDLPLHANVASRVDAASLQRFHEDNGKTAMRQAARLLTKAGHLYENSLSVGDPASEITRMARMGRYDLIIMGSHGRSVVQSLFLGSVVVKVLSTSKTPVLVVR